VSAKAEVKAAARPSGIKKSGRKSKGFSSTFDLNTDLPDAGPWPVATVNFKRPFGDMSYFELDMVRTSGIDLKLNSKDPEEDRLFGLYQQMHVALQIFVMNAVI
jgi:hypothetical protein